MKGFSIASANCCVMAEYENAMSLLMKAADQNDQQSAEYFNLLGVLYEAQGKWRLAQVLRQGHRRG